MKPGRLFFFLANIFLSFSFRDYFIRRCIVILRAFVFQIIAISIVSGAVVAYLTFTLSAHNPFDIPIEKFLPFLYSRLVFDEICPLIAFFTVLGQCCISTGLELHNCARRGEMEILYLYRVNPIGIYISPFIATSMLLGALACGGFIMASFAIIFLMVYLFEPGFFSFNVEKYWNLMRAGPMSVVFIKTILFTMFASLIVSYYSMRNYTKTDKFKVANVIAISLLLSRAIDLSFLLLKEQAHKLIKFLIPYS